MSQSIATAAPPPPDLEIDASNNGNPIQGKVLTDNPFPLFMGTAAPGEGSIELRLDGTDDGPLTFVPPGSGTFAGFALIGEGLHSLTAVQIDNGLTSAPSNVITLYELPPEVNGISTVPLTISAFESLLAQGYQLRPSPFTQTYQLLDGAIGVSNSGNVGNNTINLLGSSEVTLGAGSNTVQAASGADTIVATASSTETVIEQGFGTVLFYGGNASTQAVASVVGGTGGATLVGGANNTLIYNGGGPGTGAIIVAGAGSETLFGASSQSNEQFWGNFGGGSDLMFAGSGTDILVAGNGSQTLVGGASVDVFYVVNANIVGAMTGTQPISGHDVLYNTHAGDIIALTGYDSLYGSPGSQAAADAVFSALAAGNPTVVLKDGTTISFAGATQGLRIVSS